VTGWRDEELGSALRQLGVPAHRPGFYPRLLERLQEDDAGSTPVRPASPRWRRPTLLATAAAAVVLVVLAASIVLPGEDGPGRLPGGIDVGPRVATAAEVRTRVTEALATARTLRGEVTLECEVAYGPCLPEGGRTSLRWSFVTTAAGDERVTGIGRPDDVAYSVERGVQRELTDLGEGPPAAVEARGLPAGPPDFAARPSVLRRELASLLRVFLDTDADVPVTESTDDGRPSWRLSIPVRPNKLAGPGRSGDRLDVTVDRQSGFPLQITETLGGSFLNQIRLSKLVVDGPVDPGAFSFDFPAGVRPFVQDVGFRRVRLEDAATVVGYQPLVPKQLPPGFTMAEVTVAPRSGPTGTEAMNPPSRNVVSIAYRRGFDRIVVTTRSTSGQQWEDPLASGEGVVDEPERFTVASGALTGARAELVVTPRGIPHVWTVDDRLVVTVGGDADRDELRGMIGSF